MPELKAATFDCYGTLVDSQGGLGAFLYDLARRSGEGDRGPGSELRPRWEEIERGLAQGEYRSYLDVLEDTLRTWVGERGYRWNRMLHALDARPEEVLHVAGKPQYDVAPAASLGFRTAWLSRSGESRAGEVPFDHEWESLRGLLELVES